MRSTDTTLQPQQVTSPAAASGRSSVDQQIMDQFTQMRSMLSSFLRQKLETIHAEFCNYLASEVEGLEEKDFQTFRNEAVKFLSTIQSKAEECGCQPQQPRGKLATDTFTKLKCNFNICATDISTATAASTSCKGIYLNHPRDTETFKSGHPSQVGIRIWSTSSQEDVTDPTFLRTFLWF